jgi:hypothetical protein
MFTIDLLKGAGKPPQSRPLRIAGATLAFLVLIVAGGVDGLRYFRDEGLLTTQRRTLAYYQGEIAKMKDIADSLAAAEKRRIEINTILDEVNKVLVYHATWSSLISTMAINTPQELLLTDIMAKREEQGVGDKARFEYTLMLGAVSPSGAAMVEQFVRALRLSLPLQPGPDSVRIISQRQEMVGGQSLQYYVVECRLKMRESP